MARRQGKCKKWIFWADFGAKIEFYRGGWIWSNSGGLGRAGELANICGFYNGFMEDCGGQLVDFSLCSLRSIVKIWR